MSYNNNQTNQNNGKRYPTGLQLINANTTKGENFCFAAIGPVFLNKIEAKQTQNGNMNISASVAVKFQAYKFNRMFGTNYGDDDTVFVNLTFWMSSEEGKSAVGDRLTKLLNSPKLQSMPRFVLYGSMKANSYTSTKDGQTKVSMTMTVNDYEPIFNVDSKPIDQPGCVIVLPGANAPQQNFGAQMQNFGNQAPQNGFNAPTGQAFPQNGFVNAPMQNGFTNGQNMYPQGGYNQNVQQGGNPQQTSFGGNQQQTAFGGNQQQTSFGGNQQQNQNRNSFGMQQNSSFGNGGQNPGYQAQGNNQRQNYQPNQQQGMNQNNAPVNVPQNQNAGYQQNGNFQQQPQQAPNYGTQGFTTVYNDADLPF